MEGEGRNVIMYSSNGFSEHELENLMQHIDERIKKHLQETELPCAVTIIPQGGIIKATCSSYEEIILLVCIVNNWHEHPLDIVYEEYFPNHQLAVFIPEIRLDISKIFSQICKSNRGINSSHWTVAEQAELLTGTQLTFNVDFASFMFVERNHSVLNFKDFQLNVQLIRQ
jgi:hypothetical protein